MGSEEKSPDAGDGGVFGDETQFEAVVRELTRPIEKQALRIIGDPVHAEEVVQESLFQMWLHRDSFDPARGSPAGWAMAIVRHLAVDRVRSEQAAARRDTLFAARHTPTLYDEVVDAVERIHDYERIRRLLRDLTEVQRQAIELVYFGHLSISQVAERLRIPVPTLRTRLRDAREALEAILGSE